MPFFCGSCRIGFVGDEDFVFQRCPSCHGLGKSTETWGPRAPSAPSSYFDTALGIHITGPRHKSRVLNERGLVEIGNEPIPWRKESEQPILTDSEWRTAWNEVSSMKNSETGDA